MKHIEINPEVIKNEIIMRMLKTRRKKYKWFFRALSTAPYISLFATGNSDRGDFLESYYPLMHDIDDVVDGHADLPEGYKSSVEYIENRINFANDPTNPKESIDYLMLHCFELADKFGEDFSEETQDILYSMLFDAKRNGKMIIFSEEELLYHFNLLDIRGTIPATLKVFIEYPLGYSNNLIEDSLKYQLLEPLGLATRMYYNLRDYYPEDIVSGQVNISAEDCEKFKIMPHDLENRLSLGVQRWFKDQSEKGMGLLVQYQEGRRLLTEQLAEDKESIPEGDFKLYTKLALPLLYELPARRYFEKTLKL